jgi:hypothetical protein
LLLFSILKILNYASNIQGSPVAKKVGRQNVLKPKDEQVIVYWVQKMASFGFLITNNELLDSIQHSLNRTNRITNFKNNRPSLQWIPKFQKRHDLSPRISENMDIGKAQITPDDLKKWSERFGTY